MAVTLLAAGCYDGTDACPAGECGSKTAGDPAAATETPDGVTSDADRDGDANDGGEPSDGDDDGGDDTDDGDDTDTPDDPPSGRGLPCDVRDVVDLHCTWCHDAMPIYGAPMSLYDVVAWRVPALSDPTHTVAETAAIRLVDDVAPMPASGPLPAEDLAVLQAWIAAGTPSDEAACEGDTDAGDSGGDGDGDGDGDTGAETGPDPDPQPDPHPDPPTPDDLPCEPTVVFTAHDGGDAFHVPAEGAGNLYQCFTFASPVGAQTQAIAWAPIIDDERVLHHWVLLRTETPQIDGGSGPCNLPADYTIVAAWAPGGDTYELPDDVGLELGGTQASFILQLHYHNAAHYEDAFDRSGVAMCVVDQPREHTAALITFGTEQIDIPADVASHQEQGMCPSATTGAMSEPLHVISTFPHMHERGVAMRTDILRGGEGGPAELLVEVPYFDFNSQTFIPIEPEILIEPGDAVRTTCTYANEGGAAAHYGLDSEDEMCFNFAMVWPIDAFGGGRECMF